MNYSKLCLDQSFIWIKKKTHKISVSVKFVISLLSQSVWTDRMHLYENESLNLELWPLLLTWFNFNPSMDK